ncbi:MAG: BMP family ABC transporter substrate-binding protein [Oscillospiraceae bacterium]
MKKLISLIMVCLMMALTLAACGGDTSTPAAGGSGSDGSTASTGEKKLVYLFIKNRGDLSYWDSMAEGGDRAATDFADVADIKVIETTADLQANLTAMYEAADAGADMIITASDFKDNLITIAQENPEIACVILSENIVDEADNIYGIDFRSSEAGFLAGIVAADAATSGLEGTSGDKTVGFIGGMDETIVIQEFFLGYIQGAKYFDPDIKVVYNYVGGWGDPDTARTQALTQYNDAKADVIFACAGGSGNGVHTAAADVGKYVIGVDSDQTLMYEEDPEIQSRFVTSVLKLSGNGIYSTIEEYLNTGTLPFGEYKILGLKENAVGLVENDLFNQYVSEEGKAALAKATQEISDGVVTVEGALGKEQSEIKALIDELIK